MFKDRAFLVKVVKDPNTIVLGESQPVDVDALGQTIMKYTVLVIAAYMGADTLRQVAVHTAKIMIQPE